MKLRLTFKDPDALSRALVELESDEDITPPRAEITKAVDTWLRWGEYVDIEIDTETNLAKVLKAGE